MAQRPLPHFTAAQQRPSRPPLPPTSSSLASSSRPARQDSLRKQGRPLEGVAMDGRGAYLEAALENRRLQGVAGSGKGGGGVLRETQPGQQGHRADKGKQVDAQEDMRAFANAYGGQVGSWEDEQHRQENARQEVLRSSTTAPAPASSSTATLPAQHLSRMNSTRRYMAQLDDDDDLEALGEGNDNRSTWQSSAWASEARDSVATLNTVPQAKAKGVPRESTMTVASVDGADPFSYSVYATLPSPSDPSFPHPLPSTHHFHPDSASSRPTDSLLSARPTDSYLPSPHDSTIWNEVTAAVGADPSYLSRSAGPASTAGGVAFPSVGSTPSLSASQPASSTGSQGRVRSQTVSKNFSRPFFAAPSTAPPSPKPAPSSPPPRSSPPRPALTNTTFQRPRPAPSPQHSGDSYAPSTLGLENSLSHQHNHHDLDRSSSLGHASSTSHLSSPLDRSSSLGHSSAQCHAAPSLSHSWEDRQATGLALHEEAKRAIALARGKSQRAVRERGRQERAEGVEELSEGKTKLKEDGRIVPPLPEGHHHYHASPSSGPLAAGVVSHQPQESTSSSIHFSPDPPPPPPASAAAATAHFSLSYYHSHSHSHEPSLTSPPPAGAQYASFPSASTPSTSSPSASAFAEDIPRSSPSLSSSHPLPPTLPVSIPLGPPSPAPEPYSFSASPPLNSPPPPPPPRPQTRQRNVLRKPRPHPPPPGSAAASSVEMSRSLSAASSSPSLSSSFDKDKERGGGGGGGTWARFRARSKSRGASDAVPVPSPSPSFHHPSLLSSSSSFSGGALPISHPSDALPLPLSSPSPGSTLSQAEFARLAASRPAFNRARTDASGLSGGLGAGGAGGGKLKNVEGVRSVKVLFGPGGEGGVVGGVGVGEGDGEGEGEVETLAFGPPRPPALAMGMARSLSDFGPSTVPSSSSSTALPASASASILSFSVSGQLSPHPSSGPAAPFMAMGQGNGHDRHASAVPSLYSQYSYYGDQLPPDSPVVVQSRQPSPGATAVKFVDGGGGTGGKRASTTMEKLGLGLFGASVHKGGSKMGMMEAGMGMGMGVGGRQGGKEVVEKREPETADDYLQVGIDLHEHGELERAAWCFEQSAKRNGGCGAGMLMYGLTLRHGWGCATNAPLGFRYLQLAAESVVEDLDRVVFGGRSLTEAEANTKAAKSELVLALHEMGISYRFGWGVAKDKKLACSYFKLAADLGDIDAQVDLAFMLANGKGCKKDMREAAKYYRMAIQQGAESFGLSWVRKKKWGGDE
ncbi:hypothetical protein JCM8547_000446 [Rhodosporidiobolus lusitaniae]